MHPLTTVGQMKEVLGSRMGCRPESIQLATSDDPPQELRDDDMSFQNLRTNGLTALRTAGDGERLDLWTALRTQKKTNLLLSDW